MSELLGCIVGALLLSAYAVLRDVQRGHHQPSPEENVDGTHAVDG